MKEQLIKTNKPLFRTHNSVSVEEIMAVGGPTIYGLLSGKNNESMIKAMEAIPNDDPITDEELHDMLQQLRDTK